MIFMAGGTGHREGKYHNSIDKNFKEVDYFLVFRAETMISRIYRFHIDNWSAGVSKYFQQIQRIL